MVSPEYQRSWTYSVRKRNGLETDPEGVQLEIPLDSLFVFQNAYLFFAYECFTCACVCTSYACLGIQKRVSDFQALALGMVVSHNVSAGNQTWGLARAACAQKC